eukprot:GFYU01003026.1.p1 GENE.GFYU01003026.1~~GFYU01003026.1.p1  ORF type:complete len:227 (-),score=71.64 GFYU01003026.1:214-894(-)
MPLVFGYWNIRGLGAPCRYLMHYCGAEWEPKVYDIGGPPEYSAKESTYFGEKFNLGLDFPNLPFLFDGDLKISQTNAIMAYICRKYKPELVGRDVKEEAMVHMLAIEVMDVRDVLIGLVYYPDYDKRFDGVMKTLRSKMERLNTFLGSKTWLMGDQITYPDFHLAEMTWQLPQMQADMLDGLDNLKAHLKRYEALPEVQEFQKDARYVHMPINQMFSSFPGCPKQT